DLQRRDPAGVRGDPQGRDRRHHLAAGRPVREVRAVLRQGGAGGQDVRARRDGPRQHDHRAAERPGGPAPRPAGHQGERRRPHPLGQPGQVMKNHVEARNIVKRFGPTTALDGAHITITEGETHALVGRNGAGKSTLVSILTGLQRPDEGEVRFSGEPAPAPGDRDAWRRRVACVYQKSTIIPALSVAENLFLNRQTEGRFINWRTLRARARELLDTYEVDVDPRTPAGDLGVEQRQLVEIARALSFGARFIILDEPTARLDGPAVERLFARMRALREQGVTMMYISHHLDEVYEICQSVTVFRDARHIMTAPVA